MNFLKWTWRIIWRLIFIPFIFTLIVMIISLFLIDDSNQTTERTKAIDKNYGTSYSHYQDVASNNPSAVTKFNKYNSADEKTYLPKQVEMQDSDFDTTSIVTMTAFFGCFIVMLIYSISDIRDRRKEKLNKEKSMSS
jgi:ascorbate-specific PTS system EIIC-type component UlaA